MHRPLRTASLAIGLLVSGAFFSSCADGGTTKPTTSPSAAVAVGGGPRVMSATMPNVRIAEIHYDNAGTDFGEAIEISAPVSIDLTGWSIVLYNGSGGASYDTDVITAAMVATPTICPGGSRQIVVMTYASNGIQNGSPDGIAIVSPAGVVSEFVSYEGPFTATNGPANGMLSMDIGVAEGGNEVIQGSGVTAVVQSLKRSGSDTWTVPL